MARDADARRLRRWVVVAAGGLAFGALAGYLGSSGSVTHVLILAVVLLPVVLWRRPHLAPAVLLSAAVLVEQGVQFPHIPLTENIPMFKGVGPGHLEGADILLLMVLGIYWVKVRKRGERWAPRTHVSLAVRCVLACVAMALVVGQVHHGDLRVGLMEARPYIYLAATYFVSSVLIRDRKAIRALLWAFVGSVAFKALQGIYVWIENRHMSPRPEAYISHEASYFFVIYMVLVLALWLFGQSGTLRKWATWLLPVVIWANVVNDRRASWEMLGGALLCVGVIAYKALPVRRNLLGKVIVGLVLASAVYFPVMWDSNSSLGQPARAIKSQIKPSARDAASDIYRVQENANLELNIKQDGLLGKGFGVRIDYALPITDISQADALIAYIPHNDVLDVLMRMGLLGGVAMWLLIAAGIISGSRLAMSQDREVALIGAVLAGSVVAYALMGAVDQGFFFSRIAFITGVLLGLAEAARRLARTDIERRSEPNLAQAYRLARALSQTNRPGGTPLGLAGMVAPDRHCNSVIATLSAGESHRGPARGIGIETFTFPTGGDLIDVDGTARLVRRHRHIRLVLVQSSHGRRPHTIEALGAAPPASRSRSS